MRYLRCTLTFVGFMAIVGKSAQSPATETSSSNKDSLTLNGTTLTVGDLGAQKTLSLSVKDLRLLRGAKIITNGNTLVIKADRIISDGGSIVSFLPDALTPAVAPPGFPGVAGLDGGAVELDVVSLEGKLKIDLAGQNGGQGGQGLRGGNGPQGQRGDDGADSLFGCSRGASNGRPGGMGNPGARGFPGGSGGNGGILILPGQAATVQEEINFSASQGKGGPGGLGGPGGQGGAGGQGGSGSVFCRGGTPGPMGVQGPNGPPGAFGSGNLGMVANTIMLSSIEVKQDGSEGPTEWRFEFRINGFKPVNIPPRKYDNKKEKSIKLQGAPLSVWLGQRLDIEVKGYRTTNNVTADGRIGIILNDSSVGKQIPVKVENVIPLRGSFVFDFLVTNGTN